MLFDPKLEVSAYSRKERHGMSFLTPILWTNSRIALLTTLNSQLLVVPKAKCLSDWKSDKFDFLCNGRMYGHDFFSVCFWLREDCKKRTHCMRHSFFGT